jgi:hypothetical protein
MAKNILVGLLIIVIILGMFISQKNLIVARILEKEAQETLGLKISMDSLDVSLFATHLRIRGLRVYNPQDFNVKEMAYIPSVMIICDPVEYLKTRHFELYFLDLDIDHVNVVKNKDGKVNLKEIKIIKDLMEHSAGNRPAKPQEKRGSVFSLDVFRLTFKEVYYTDYSGSRSTETKKYALNIKDQVFTNVDSFRDIIDLIILKIIDNTEVGRLVNLSLSPILEDASNVVELTGKALKDTMRGVISPFAIIFGNH